MQSRLVCGVEALTLEGDPNETEHLPGLLTTGAVGRVIMDHVSLFKLVSAVTAVLV